MAQQLSRPFQIALGAVVLFALVWFVALHGHGASPATTAAPRTVASSPARAVVKPHVVTPRTVKPSAVHRKIVRHSGIPAKQAAVESELKQGKVVVVLFWNKQGADDDAVHTELKLLASLHRHVEAHAKQPAVERELKEYELELNRPIAVHYATAGQVASFGSITRGVQVYSTPTILIVNGRGQTTTLTGLQDTLSIEQAIDEARQAQS